MTARLYLVVALVACAGTWARSSEPRDVPLPASLSAMPLDLEGWRGVEGPRIDEEIMRVLRADDYVNRVYRGPGGELIGLWIAFYASQRQGDAIHSPLNCLPGTGWAPIDHSRPVIDVNGRAVPINRYLVEKRGERQLVLYWYQGRGRIVASEYTNKAYLLVDAVRRKRTDGALVRITTPVLGDERTAERAARAFIRDLQPHLSRWLP